MKKTLILILTMTIPAMACLAQTNLKQKNEKFLTGHWKLDTMYMDIDLSDEYMEIFRAKYKELKKETEFIFRPDGSYTKLSTEPPRQGQWSISQNGKIIIIEFDDSDEVSKTRIRSLSEDKMDMEPVGDATNTRVLLHKTE
ncbi:MAG: lipocalin family protein [Bacteroidales bacterium]